MKKGKSYNRIVFLTTLSVYLGLVLVGGTAPVLAHSALTRGFDVRNEIELQDDLDNKPENDEAESFFALGLERAVADFVEDLRRLKRQGRYSSAYKEALASSCTHSYCSGDAANASISLDGQDGEVIDALADLHTRIEVSEENNFYKNLYDGFRKDKRDGCKEIGLRLTFDENALNISLEFPRESAEKASGFARGLNRAFAAKSTGAKDALTKQIYEKTKATSENNQVFVVTRLPRASIDSLLTRTK